MNPGQNIGPYLVLKPLGAGGMGEVCLARDTRLNREVALKRLSDPALASDVARRRVLREARAAAGLSHPNIATIFDVLDDGDRPIIVMEYVPGEALAREIARGPVPVARAVALGRQIAQALADAHERGIIHRDLKPANIQVTPDGTAKILDFGIARAAAPDPTEPWHAGEDSRTGLGRIVGTPGYMAPEQLAAGAVDQRTDLYALGLLLFEMLTGARPFDADDVVGNAMAVFGGRTPRISDVAPHVPAELSALVESAMAPDPAQRPQTARQVAATLATIERTQSDAPTADSRPPARRWHRWWARSGTWRAVTALAAVLFALAVWQISRVWDARPVRASPALVAVLPLENRTTDASNDSLALGLTDALAARLSEESSLRVLSDDDVREAMHGVDDPVRVARTLGAGYVIRGGVSGRAGRVEVDLSLIGNDGRRWPGGRHDVRTTDLFAVHDRVTDGITAALEEAGAMPRTSARPAVRPTPNQEAFAEYAQGRVFLERPDVPGNLDHAIRLFRSAIDKDNRFSLAYAALGQACWAQYRESHEPEWTTRATAAILEALRIDRDQPEVRLSLAVMYQGLGRLEDAEEELLQVLEARPDNDDARRVLAGLHMDRGRWDDAIAELHRAIELRPNYWRNHSELGYAYFRAGRLDEAAAAYTRVIELQPDNARGFHMLGTVVHSAGRMEEALRHYEKANAILPSAGTLSNIGTIHYWRGDYARAAGAYEEAIALAPHQPDLHANLGDARQKQGDRQRAVQAYRRAVDEIQKLLAVNDRDALNLSLLALYQAKLGDRADADLAIKRALAISPRDAEVLYAHAIVATLARRTDEACQALEQAVAQGASTEIIRQADELKTLKDCPAYARATVR